MRGRPGQRLAPERSALVEVGPERGWPGRGRPRRGRPCRCPGEVGPLAGQPGNFETESLPSTVPPGQGLGTRACIPSDLEKDEPAPSFRVLRGPPRVMLDQIQLRLTLALPCEQGDPGKAVVAPRPFPEIMGSPPSGVNVFHLRQLRVQAHGQMPAKLVGQPLLYASHQVVPIHVADGTLDSGEILPSRCSLLLPDP